MNTKKYHLLNFILPSEDLEDFNSIKNNSRNIDNYDFNQIVKKYNLEDYIIMIVFKNDKGISVLNKINFNNKIDLKNVDFPNINLKNEKVQFLPKIYAGYNLNRQFVSEDANVFDPDGFQSNNVNFSSSD